MERKQVEELIEFWVVKVEDEGPEKRNKSVSRGATSPEGSQRQGKTGDGREKRQGGCVHRKRRMGE